MCDKRLQPLICHGQKNNMPTINLFDVRTNWTKTNSLLYFLVYIYFEFCCCLLVHSFLVRARCATQLHENAHHPQMQNFRIPTGCLFGAWGNRKKYRPFQIYCHSSGFCLHFVHSNFSVSINIFENKTAQHPCLRMPGASYGIRNLFSVWSVVALFVSCILHIYVVHISAYRCRCHVCRRSGRYLAGWRASPKTLPMCAGCLGKVLPPLEYPRQREHGSYTCQSGRKENVSEHQLHNELALRQDKVCGGVLLHGICPVDQALNWLDALCRPDLLLL